MFVNKSIMYQYHLKIPGIEFLMLDWIIRSIQLSVALEATCVILLLINLDFLQPYPSCSTQL